jgi:5-formyltetrahydrofolate cyclo-ligase
VQLAAEQIDEREQLRAQVLEQPDNIRLRSGLRELEKALVGNLARMGFTPSDRSRLGFAEVKKESKLEELRRKLEDR